MAIATNLRGIARANVSLLSSGAYIVLVAVAAWLDRNPVLAVYLLSFWHYYLYALAYCFGAFALPVLKRDAIAMKAVALVALGMVYLDAPTDFVSLAVVAAGFALNCAAAMAMGSDRTYYGYEIGALPRLRINAFPYSWLSHPMLAGNIIAFGGTLINAGFREQWWPLAVAHVSLNIGLMVMEIAVQPRRQGAHAPAGEAGVSAPICSLRFMVAVGAAGTLLGGMLGSWSASGTHTLPGAIIGGATLIHAFVIFRTYSSPIIWPGDGRVAEAGRGPP